MSANYEDKTDSSKRILNHYAYALSIVGGDIPEGYMYGWQIKEIYPDYFHHHKLKESQLYEIL